MHLKVIVKKSALSISLFPDNLQIGCERRSHLTYLSDTRIIKPLNVEQIYTYIYIRYVVWGLKTDPTN